MKWLRTVSWMLLLVVGLAVLGFALVSANVGYRRDFNVGGASIVDIAAGREGVLLGLRGVRGTAAAWAAAWAALFLSVVLGPYRRGDIASWWGILASVLVFGAVTALRVPLLGISAGTATALVLLVLVIVTLLLDVRRLAGPR